jgi:hypothetical protein
MRNILGLPESADQSVMIISVAHGPADRLLVKLTAPSCA